MNIIILQSATVDHKDTKDFFSEALTKKGHHPIKVDPANISFNANGIIANNRFYRLNEIDGVIWRVSMADTEKARPFVAKFAEAGIAVTENETAAINARSKIRSAEIFAEQNIPIPETICIKADHITPEAIKNGFERLSSEDGVVLKANMGFRGEQVHFPANADEAVTLALAYEHTGILLQKRIPTIDKTTLRANIVDGNIINTIRQYPAAGQETSNLGPIEPVTLTEEQRKIALDAANAIGLHFTAIDLIVGMDNKTYVLEANDTPAVHFLKTSLRPADKETIGTRLRDEVVNAVIDRFLEKIPQKTAIHHISK